jgi:CBS domain-containing protein
MLDKPVNALIPTGQVDHVEADQTVLDAVRYMASVRRGAVPVISDTLLVGMFSERDLMLRVVLAGLDPASTRVKDVMSKELVVAQSTDLCRDCLDKMKLKHFRHLPVVEAGTLVGILSLRDLMEAEAEGRAREIEMLNYYVSYGS